MKSIFSCSFLFAVTFYYFNTIFFILQIDTTCNDEDLFSLVLETKTVDKITMTTLYKSFVDYILTKSQNESIFDDVVSQLKSAGLFAEAGTLILRQRSLHEGLSTIDNAVMTFKAWFKR